jgi:hypothetical protein
VTDFYARRGAARQIQPSTRSSARPLAEYGFLSTAFRNYDDVFSLMRPAAALREQAGSAARSNPGA